MVNLLSGRLGALWVGVIVVALALTSCGNSSTKASTTRTKVAPTHSTVPSQSTPTTNPQVPTHVYEIVMENLSYGSYTQVPALTALATQYASDALYYSAAHPSLPNYLALTAGQTFGITSDCLQCYVSSSNLADQLTTANISWNAYFEGVSQPCYLGTSYGVYAAKHNPFRYFNDIRGSTSLCGHLQPLANLESALTSSPTSVPNFVWITPNICNDGHDCGPSVGGTWLTGMIQRITQSPAWNANSLILVVWDEGSGGDPSSISSTGVVSGSGGGGHAPMLVVSPHLRAGEVLQTPMSPYGVLATIESIFHLPYLGQAAQWSSTNLAKLTQ